MNIKKILMLCLLLGIAAITIGSVRVLDLKPKSIIEQYTISGDIGSSMVVTEFRSASGYRCIAVEFKYSMGGLGISCQ